MVLNNLKSEPWERLPNETSKAFGAFVVYRDMEMKERSIRKVAQKLYKSCTNIAKWSKKFSWVDRATQYDAYLDRLAMERTENERKEIAKINLKTAKVMLTKGIAALQAIPIDEIKAADIIKMIETAVKIDRLVRGESTENSQTFGKYGSPSVVQIYIPTNGREINE